MNWLKIPLNTTQVNAKRYFTVIAICVFLVAWILPRIYTALDTTSWLRPANTAYTIHLPMSPSSAAQLSAHLGEETVFPNTPWTVNHLIAWCERSCSIHLNEFWQVQGVSLQKPLEESASSQLVATGLTVTSYNNTFLIHTDSDDVASTKEGGSLALSELLPWNDATAINWQKDIRTAIRISKKGLMVHAQTGVSDPHQHTFDEDVQILAQLSIDSVSEQTSIAMIPPQAQAFLANISKGPVSIALALDSDQRLVYSLQAATTLDQQEVAQITHELIKPLSLSTLEWTIKDGTSVEEIRFSDDDVTVDTRTENGIFFLEVRKNTDILLRLTQADGRTILSNTDISLTNPLLSSSSCASATQSFILPKSLVKTLLSSNQPSGLASYGALYTFSEIAFFPERVLLCW